MKTVATCVIWASGGVIIFWILLLVFGLFLVDLRGTGAGSLQDYWEMKDSVFQYGLTLFQVSWVVWIMASMVREAA
jgi:hypothetical protein